MKVLIVGAGVVGRATGKAMAMKPWSHEVEYLDPPQNITPPKGWEPELAVFCVPTPYGKLRIINEAMQSVSKTCGHDCIFMIKSTVPPGYTDSMQVALPQPVLFSPEFLTEATAERDAAQPARLVLGYAGEADSSSALACQKLILPCPGGLFFVVRATAAELIKLWTNSFYATKVTLANQLFDAAESLGVDYEMIRRVLEQDPMIAAQHLDVHHGGYRGFGGKCLPKDLSWMIDVLEWSGNFPGAESRRAAVLKAVRTYNNNLRVDEE